MQRIKHFFQKFAELIGFLTRNFKGVLLFIFILWLILPSADQKISPANLVQIDLTGQIIDSTKVVEMIEEASGDKEIKGVLFVVNSPGGSVAASIEIAYAIKRLAEAKPVVTYASGAIASGSYYAAIWSHSIIANPGALVGSIGVILHGYNFEDIMQKAGVSTQIVKAGRFKEAGTSSREWKPYEKAELESVVQDTYQMFVFDVAQARKLDLKDEKKFADAHIFNARQAEAVGLIDRVGTIFEAKKDLIKLAKISKPVWQKPSLLENFTQRVASDAVSLINAALIQPQLK